MEWLLSSPQIHSTFGSLGFNKSDGYHIDENCNAALKNILYNIVTEDKILHSYRKSINFGQYVKKDLIPVLIHAQDNETIQLSIEILVNLTIPVECLLSVETLSKTDCGRQTIFEIKNLLSSTKHAFSDQRTTKVVMDFFKKNLETQGEFSHEQRANINNCLLLLRNILNIPEELKGSNQNERTLQNQIVWNVFSQSLDKILLKLMTMPEVNLWSVIIVQLVALFYKDQHVVTLHKHLKLWLEATLSESSEDNESNTSPPGRGSEDSLPILTSDPTSDSSDTGGSRKSNDEQNLMKSQWDESNTMDIDSNMLKKLTNSTDKSNSTLLKEETELHSFETKDDIDKMRSSDSKCTDIKTKMLTSENSDCGYGTQMETQESISTSSNDDDLPAKKSFYQKPHNSKLRVNPKPRMGTTLQERKRKKIVRRGKRNNINIHGLLHKTPTEDDISNVLKEFTVDFLLKGYNSLVQTLHEQIITNLQLEIDTSHFFWLLTYFLKFVAQIELDVEHLDSVLSYDIISYLTAEGVILCEQLELALKLDGSNLKPCIRKLHLLFTAIREFVQTIEIYTKLPHLSKENKETLEKLKLKICETDELRSLMVLLLMHYNSLYLSKQYLQDLIVTNHIILSFVDNSMRELVSHKRTNNMPDHIRQFATPKIMYQYGLLLEDYAVNGEFVNDCIFTMMHHVGGELDSLITLFQPKILKTFTSIWKSEFEICDDWSDLIEYVINTFVKKPRTMQSLADVRIETQNFDENVVNKQPPPSYPEVQPDQNESLWNAEEISSLNWIYMQCSSADVIGEILKSLEDDGIVKSRQSIIKELHKENTITNEQYEEFMKNEIGLRTTFSAKGVRNEEINKLCEQLRNDGKPNFLHWVQTVLLDTCFVRIYLDKKPHQIENIKTRYMQGRKLFNRDMFKKKSYEIPVMSSIAYHSLVAKKSVPLVPWNCEQAAICKDLKFLQLLHKLGFHMPVDSGRVFIRIPHIWTAEFLYEIAGKIGPVDTQKLKFCIDDIRSYKTENLSIQSSDMMEDISKETTSLKNSENAYKMHTSKHVTTMVNFTPMPSTSFTADIEEKFNKENWLELVKKSQDCKLSLYVPRMDEIQKADVACSEIIPDDVEGFHGRNAQSCSSRLPGPSPVVTSIINGHTLFSSMSLSESEDNSLCDTATTASDLTRMYVSDEDEKLIVEASQRAAFCPKSKAPNVRLGKRRHIRSKPAVRRRHYTKD